MINPTEITITEAEWEVMRVVWANGATTSREIIEILGNKMDWKDATIKTLVGRLVSKGALQTEKDGRKFIYVAAISEKDSMENHTSGILSLVCKKQNSDVVRTIIQEAALSKADIDDLMKLLQEKQITAPEVVPCDCLPGQCECHLLH